MILRVILYATILLIAIWPIASIFQSAVCGLLVRLFVRKENRIISLMEWPWYMKTTSFAVALLFWLGINEIYKALTNTSIPLVLAAGIYIAVALYTKSRKGEMNLAFRTNKTNEVYATLLFFLYQSFLAKSTVLF